MAQSRTPEAGVGGGQVTNDEARKCEDADQNQQAEASYQDQQVSRLIVYRWVRCTACDGDSQMDHDWHGKMACTRNVLQLERDWHAVRFAATPGEG